MTEHLDWSVRNERTSRQTGFGSNEDIARKAYEGLIEKAKRTGTGGEFSLYCDGVLVARAYVPAKGD